MCVIFCTQESGETPSTHSVSQYSRLDLQFQNAALFAIIDLFKVWCETMLGTCTFPLYNVWREHTLRFEDIVDEQEQFVKWWKLKDDIFHYIKDLLLTKMCREKG